MKRIIIVVFTLTAAIGIGILGGGIMATRKQLSVSPWTKSGENWFPRVTQTTEAEADARRTSMPKSQWDRAVAKAVAGQCTILGMSKQEVLLAFGEPTGREFDDTAWTWKLPDGACLKYAGDNCAERQHLEGFIHFTPNGYNLSYTDACEDKHRLFVYSNAELFGN
jgi:hypothetical protein